MEWEKYTSKKYLRPYWFNRKTGESRWTNPEETPLEEGKKMTDKEIKNKLIRERRKERASLNDLAGRNHKGIIAAMEQFESTFRTPKNETKKEEKHEMQIANGNGMQWTIEGKSHWTKEDYMDELRSINQSLRDR